MYPIKDLLKTVDIYIDKTSRQVMFEYLMIEGVNDQEEHAEQLAEQLNTMKNHLYIVNLIRYNPTGTTYRASNPAVIKKFKNRLMRQGIKATERHTFGQDIDAACGQLATKKKLN
jgi:23S rRNA (adenine2503-C2)-methyltransferase